MTKIEEEAEVLNALFIPIFNSKIVCLLCTHDSELEDREENEGTINSGEVVSDLLHHLGISRSMQSILGY